jgi:tungstate transport system substrate-binding protein
VKRILTILFLLAFFLSACTPATPAPPKEVPFTTVPPTPVPTTPANPTLILATTTSTQDSGLLDVLIPLFETETGFTVQTVAVGSGQAMQMGQEAMLMFIVVAIR